MAIDHKARARRVWPILVKLAKNGSPPITYGEISGVIGLHPRTAQWFLGEIQKFCKKEKLPPLQALVVNKKSKLPGPGYHDSGRTPRADLKRVYAYKKWPSAKAIK